MMLKITNYELIIKNPPKGGFLLKVYILTVLLNKCIINQVIKFSTLKKRLPVKCTQVVS